MGQIVKTAGGKIIEKAQQDIIYNSEGSIANNAAKKIQQQGIEKGISYGDYEQLTTSKEVCTCKISKKASNFKELILLIKQAEDMLIKNSYRDIGDRISIIRGIYYGTEWSLDYDVEKSTARNMAFNTYTGSTVKADAREKLKCFKDCKANLFQSLYKSPEVFDNKYKAIDFGHLIIGLDSRRSWRSRELSLGHGGTGLEMNTWVGDLGGGTANLSKQRISNPSKRAKTLFPVNGHSYGSMVNLEGDIAAYVAGMDINKPNSISDPTNKFATIYELLDDYFQKKWDKRTFYFLAMLGAKVSNNTLIYEKNNLIKNCAEKFEDFATPYLTLRAPGDLADASNFFKPISEEVASIFIDALLHVITKPEDMITARIDPIPKQKVITVKSKIKTKSEEYLRKINDALKNKKLWIDFGK